MNFSNLVRTLFILASARSAVADDTGPGGPDGPDGTGDVDEFQYEELLDAPTTLWSAQLFPDIDLGSVAIEAGNGVFMAPDGKHALVTTVGATVYAFNAYNGEQAWVYQPEAIGNSIARSHSGVVFGPLGDYMVYSVVDNENSLNPTSRVVALDMEGNEVWVSDDLEGVATGCPQVSTDGAYVYLTHNGDDLSNGYFTILDGTTGTVFYGGSSGEAGDDPTRAYGPIGIFHSPQEGNYDPITSGSPVSEGEFNTNDMLMWSQTPKPTDAAISNGNLYAFQFPRDFIGNASDVSYFQMGNFERDFQALTAPVMTNNGMSAYWAVSRSGFRGWTPKRFSRARTVTVGFSRNDDFPGQPVWAPPALSNDGPEPTIFGGSAAKEFVRMSYDFSEQIVVPTVGYVKTMALVDGDDRAVYYVESNTGTLHQANFNDLTDLWNQAMNFSVDGEMALTPRSDVLLVADTRGVITAFQVADIPITEAPSSLPSDGPSMEPSNVPTISKAPVVTTESPTAAVVPTDAPVVATEVTGVPTTEPVAEAVEAPISAPVPAPVTDTDTTSAPTSGSSVRSIFMAFAAILVAGLLL